MPWRQSPPHDMQDTACRPAEPGCPVAAWVDAMTGFEQPAYVLALDGRFVWVNEACAGLFGRPAAELLRLRFQDLTHPDDHAGDRQRIGRLIAGEVRWLQVDKRFLRPDGRTVWVRLNLHRPWRDPAAAAPELAERLLVLAREIGLDDAGREALQRSERQPWTASRTSTTRWATPPATRCWPPSARGCGSGCARATRWRGWAATSSSC